MRFLSSLLNGVLLSSSKKSVVILRHGVTEMNEYLSLPVPTNEYGNPSFIDPGFWDTNLSQKGIKFAKQKNQELKYNPTVDLKNIDIIYSSPLTRALQTADIVLDASHVPDTVPRVILPMLAERLWLSSDVGRPISVLRREFPNWDMSTVTESRWWYHPSDHINEVTERRPAGTYITPLEPAVTFQKRIDKLRLFLMEQPYDRIALVAHWGVFKELTGYSMENCEIREYSLDYILGLKKKWSVHS